MSEFPRKTPPDPPRWFWDTIEEAGGNLARYRAAIDRLSREQVIQAHAYFDDLARVFAAPIYVQHMPTGMSEDGAFDVGAWIVSQGRDHFRDVYAHPEKVPDSATPGTKEERMMLGEIIRHYLDKYDDEMPMDYRVEYPDNP